MYRLIALNEAGEFLDMRFFTQIPTISQTNTFRADVLKEYNQRAIVKLTQVETKKRYSEVS